MDIKTRQVIKKMYYNEYPLKEIAKKTNTSLRQVKYLIYERKTHKKR
jgi:hypothetical protein